MQNSSSVMPTRSPEVAEQQIAILVPCYNEALTIRNVVEGFRRNLPQAQVYVFDNNSTDDTVAVAKSAGAIVRHVQRQGKGHVVRRMFADIDADCYILVDGDDTYDPDASGQIASMVLEQDFDFVNVSRVSDAVEAYRRGHRLGNVVLTGLVRLFFGRESTDMLSGYKALSRRFVKSFPAMSHGFETETELTVHALEMRMTMGEVSAQYRERPSGSTSKLRTYQDGTRILLLIARLVKDERPAQFFGFVGLFLILLGAGLSIPVILTYVETGLVPRLPTAVLSVGTVVLGWLSIFTGIILDVVAKMRREVKRLTYLATPRPSR
ncbi:glycosyltransferase family 2 protein [Lichenihabitans sp. Uapishka_5]|uniref:glycosyltransferase family 2 protein n=1 Tax=Lichenihabitans sp. Uapishka_5 TaxID=3037302 RepID=UPI0029E7F9BB|nr:glycosyltransferase family 2 protein [Lichenihabitans sp. Uapishka_5]MDX7952400.1 glycosyltransferase family 2 protein [Lichenihabitans sp. Uapishka_5]